MAVRRRWMRALARSAMVSVTAQKAGGDSVQPMGRAKGKATRGGSPGAEGMATPSFVDWTETWVAVDDLRDQSFEGSTELHGLPWHEGYSLIVEARVGVVHNGPGAPFVLWDHSHGRDAQVGEMCDFGVWEYHPSGIVNHIGEFLA
eukprot:scaffold1805_cov104-Cylindrotheca_fusiformis.AAC.4